MRSFSSRFGTSWAYVLALGVIASIPALLFQNCANVELGLITSPVVQQFSKDNLCVTPPESVTRYNKVLFIVDKSGSNVSAPGSPSGAGTDPDGVRRFKNIQSFFDSKKDNPYYKWGLINFGVEIHRAHAYVNHDGDRFKPKFGTADEMQNAINEARAVPDAGCTPYLAGLELARAAIARDLVDNPEDISVYNVFFISDGFPNDSADENANACGQSVTVQNDPKDPYISKVNDILKLAPARVFVHTAYYTPPDIDPTRAAANGLKYLAEAGSGTFTDFQANDAIKYDDIRLGPLPETWMVKRFVTYNLSSAFCTDGTTDVDSDSDGLCDKDELLFNSKFSAQLPGGKKFNPQNRNSFSSTFSDFFVYKFQVLPNGIGLASCNAMAPDKDFDLLNTCEELLLFDTQANGPTPHWTAQMKQGGEGAASPLNPDSDGDGFLDSIEFFMFGIKSAAVNYLNIQSRYAGGITGEALMAEHRHPMRPDLMNDQAYDARFVFSGINETGQNCYDFEQQQLPLYPTQGLTLEQASGNPQLVHESGENVVLVYYLAVPERDPNGKGVYFHSFQKLNYSEAQKNPGISLGKFDFYIVPNDK